VHCAGQSWPLALIVFAAIGSFTTGRSASLLVVLSVCHCQFLRHVQPHNDVVSAASTVGLHSVSRSLRQPLMRPVRSGCSGSTAIPLPLLPYYYYYYYHYYYYYCIDAAASTVAPISLKLSRSA